MLAQPRDFQEKEEFEQLRPDFHGRQNVHRLRLDVSRLVAARYFIVFMGAVLLLSLAAQALFWDGGVTLSRVFKIALVAVLGPGLVWAASDKEMGLLKELERRTRQLEQRVRENKALNRMTQDHLADCFSDSPEHHHGTAPVRQLPEKTQEIVIEAVPAQVRSDSRNVIVLDPEDNDYDHSYFEATPASTQTR